MAHILIDQSLKQNLLDDSDLLITPKQLKTVLPIASKEHNNFIADSRKIITNILNRQEKKLLLVVGPCSIHDPKAAFDYAVKLKSLALKVEKNIYIVMRAYFAKPRTALGWQGFISDPLLDGSNKVNYGLYAGRELLINIIKLKLPVATEFLDCITVEYFNDLISYLAIGARTVDSQMHRNFVATLSIPTGFKNAISGNVDTAISAMQVAGKGNNVSLTIDDDGRAVIVNSKGNYNTNIILRGGELTGTNYHEEDIISVLNKLKKINNKKINHSIMVDCSHGNCNKNYANQKIVFQDLIKQLAKSHGSYIKGIMLESFLNSGRQEINSNLSNLEYGVSITDPCLSFSETEELILELNKKLNPCDCSY